MIRLTLAVMLAGVALPVAAQDTRASASAKYDLEFAATDTNHDGVLTRAEVQARIAKMRAGGSRIDPVHSKRLADLWFDHADANNDGKVTRDEGQALLARRSTCTTGTTTARSMPTNAPQRTGRSGGSNIYPRSFRSASVI
ncbi:hypothetical protein [uncultured Sphingomonas sp.]|uniref:hypothetical protein n=1 Tax=uncultured Sphingomonas sp. TaxID=158754 RepID=UPI0035CAB559